MQGFRDRLPAGAISGGRTDVFMVKSFYNNDLQKSNRTSAILQIGGSALSCRGYREITARQESNRMSPADDNHGASATEVKSAPLYSLPAAWYHRSEIYEAERWRIFAASWQFVGQEAELRQPGDYLAVAVAGFRLFVLKGRDGSLKAFHNLCPHRASPLFPEGSGHCDVLRCRYHGWTFDENGHLKAAPHFGEADWFKREEHGLKPVRLGNWRGLLFVNIDGKAGALTDFLGDLPALAAEYPIESFHKRDGAEFTTKCNWKTYTDNFVEGYHIPGIHPGLSSVIDFSRFETTGANHVVVMKAPQKEGSIYGGVWLWIWPNMTLSVFPGGMNASRIAPLGERLTHLQYGFYFADLSPAQEQAQRRTIETNCQIVREDFGVCENSQYNLEAGIFQHGPMSPRHEMGVHYFHDEVRAALKPAGFSDCA
jgi:choline monooxygenase